MRLELTRVGLLVELANHQRRLCPPCVSVVSSYIRLMLLQVVDTMHCLAKDLSQLEHASAVKTKKESPFS